MKSKRNAIAVQEALWAAAQTALANSYSPYSGHRVGAAVLTENDEIFSGCNVENASFGGTVCAERVACWKAISEGQRKVTHVLVVVEGPKAWSPCGFCRQILQEFGDAKTLVTMATSKKIGKTYTLHQLLPDAFGPQQMTRQKRNKAR